MKILVTGGAGFIGSHLVERLLARGDRIVVLDDFNDFYDPALKRANVSVSAGNPAYRLVEGDIRDRALVFRLFAEERFDAVVHLAARAGVRPSLTQPVLYEEVNCVATLHLLEAAVAHGRPRFVFASSSSVYGINSKLPFFVSVAELDPPSVIAFAETLKAELCKGGRCPTYMVFKDHSHISEVMSPDTADTSVTGPILKWMKAVK